jgi:hypothetical protein
MREAAGIVHFRGVNGQTPLHCASTIEIADYLLEHVVDIDARDVQHESTAVSTCCASLRLDITLGTASRSLAIS